MIFSFHETFFSTEGQLIVHPAYNKNLFPAPDYYWIHPAYNFSYGICHIIIDLKQTRNFVLMVFILV